MIYLFARAFGIFFICAFFISFDFIWRTGITVVFFAAFFFCVQDLCVSVVYLNADWLCTNVNYINTRIAIISKRFTNERGYKYFSSFLVFVLGAASILKLRLHLKRCAPAITKQ